MQAKYYFMTFFISNSLTISIVTKQEEAGTALDDCIEENVVITSQARGPTLAEIMCSILKSI